MTSPPGLSAGVGLAAAARFGSLVFGVAFQILLAKAMPTGEYASYSVAFAIAVVVATLSGLGIARSLSRFLPLVIAYGVGADLGRTLGFYLFLKVLGLGAIVGALLQLGLLNALILWSGHPPNQNVLIAWLLVLCLQFDIEAVAQALSAYRLWALTAFLEVAARAGICLSIIGFDWLHLNDLLLVWTITSALQLLVVVLALCIKGRGTHRRGCNAPDRSLIPPFRQQFKFSLSIYFSGLSWLAASPFSVRLASATELPAVPLAAISFIQTLVISALRGLPIHLLSPIMEPLLVGKSIIKGDSQATQVILSVLIKLETIIIMCFIVIAAPLGPLVITTLGKQDFAPFGFILPIMLIQALGTSYFRVAEIVAGILQVHVTFMAMLPVSLLSLMLVYITSSSLGFASLLIWPLFDTAAKLAIMLYALHSRRAAKIFDVSRLSVVIALAALLVVAAEVVIRLFGLGDVGRACLSVLAGVAFTATLFVSRPFRRLEHQLIVDIAVNKFTGIGSMFGLLAK